MDHNDFCELTRLMRDSSFEVEEIALDECPLPFAIRVQGEGEATAVGELKRKWYKRG